MNIGDKVRFLNAVGGGRITGFQGKDLVLVTDEDGFEVPTLRHEIVVVDTDAYNLERKPAPGRKSKEINPYDAAERKKRAQVAAGETHTSVKAALAAHDGEDEGDEVTKPTPLPTKTPIPPIARSPSAPVPSSEKAPTTSTSTSPSCPPTPAN